MNKGIKKIISDKFRTNFLSPLEIENYMSILGAANRGKDRFLLDGLLCEVDREYEGVYFPGGISNSIEYLFTKYNLEDSMIGWTICDLEGLILMHMALRNDVNIDNYYSKFLYDARLNILERTLSSRKKIDFKGRFREIDYIVTPFLRDDFDYRAFLDNCIFNTTGYYEKDGYDKCLRFEWYDKKEPDTIFDIRVDRDGYRSTINDKKKKLLIIHYVYDDEDKLNLYRNKECITIDSKRGEIIFGQNPEKRITCDIDDILENIGFDNSFYGTDGNKRVLR